MSLLPSPAAPVREPYRLAPDAAVRSERPLHARPPRRLDSAQLLDGDREVEIEHAGAVYRLRRTSLGKLILTK